MFQQFAILVFWASLLTMFYTYGLYPFLIFCLSKSKVQRSGNQKQGSQELPSLTVVIAAYNESQFIQQKIENTLALDYPCGRKKIIVVTDGSDDGTPEIVKTFPEVILFHEPERRGKIHAVNRVMPFVDTAIVVFSDANTLLNNESLKKIAVHYEDGSVGGVAGEKRIVKKHTDNSAGTGEGLYWRYESFIKQCDSDFFTIVGAAGELFSMRTELYEPPPANIIIEDFFISMQIVAKGFRFVYEPEAYATESASATIQDEWKRKVRISAGGLQAIFKLPRLLNPFRYGMTSFQYISHRVLRWTLAPLSLLLVLVSNFVLRSNGFYFHILLGQSLFYAVVLLGYWFRDVNVSLKGFFVPFYFAMMNFAVYAGAFRFIRGKQSVIWEKTQRAV